MSAVRVPAVALVIVGLAVAAGCGSDSDDGDSGLEPGEEIKVGLNLELSGSGEFIGRSREIGANVAIDDINEDGGIEIDGESHPLEAVTCDNRTEPTRGVTCAEQGADEGVVWSIAPDAGFEPAYEVYKQDEIIAMANGGVPSDVLEDAPDDNPLLFSEFLNFPDSVASSLSQLRILFPEAKTIATMVPDDENGRLWGEGFTASAEEYGFEVVDEQLHPPDATGDFSSFLTSMKQANPDVAYLSFLPQVSIPAIEQAAELDVAPILADNALQPQQLEGVDYSGHTVVSFNIAWGYGPGVEPEGENAEESRELIKRLNAEAGGDEYLTSITTASYISDVTIVANAIEAAGSVDPDEISDELLSADYQGALGPGVMREEDHSMDAAQTTFVHDEQGGVRVEVFNGGFDDEPAYSFEVESGGG